MDRPRSNNNDNKRRAATNLDRHYREIGISALAAALPYQSEAKNPAYAPVATRARVEEDVAA
jgi:hypothetical protein